MVLAVLFAGFLVVRTVGGEEFSVEYPVERFSPSGSLEQLAPTVRGGDAVSFEVEGELPAGVTFDSSTGVFSGAARWESTPVKLSAGRFFTCALSSEGGVKCWGSDGKGSFDPESTKINPPCPPACGEDSVAPDVPADVEGLTSGVRDITTGAYHLCVVLDTGSVRCLGYNEFGQLGDGSTVNSSRTPVEVLGIGTDAVAVSSAGGHTCAVTRARGLKCWGANWFGRLGANSDVPFSAVPLDVYGLSSGVRFFDGGGYHACALTEAGQVKCWGNNMFGQLGDGTTEHRNVPVDVKGIPGKVASMSIGMGHGCVLTEEGKVFCWGYNVFGQLGTGVSEPFSPVPVEVPLDGPAVQAVDAGGEHTCILDVTGAVRCWGNNANGQSGAPASVASTPSPVAVRGLGEVTSVRAGTYHSCATTIAGSVLCWGFDLSEMLGDKSATHPDPLPVQWFGTPGFPARVTVTARAENGSSAATEVLLSIG